MKQAQFISLVSEILGIESKTIKVIVRNLREAGLFTTGARGVNAPDITALDAARVVIAAVASSSPGKAVKDVRCFGPMKPDVREDWMNFTANLGLSPEKTLEETLVDCLENRMAHALYFRAILRLSEMGDALIIGESNAQYYHNREQSVAMNETISKINTEEGKAEFRSLWCETEATERIFTTKVNRWAELSLDLVRDIGYDLIGWEVD